MHSLLALTFSANILMFHLPFDSPKGLFFTENRVDVENLVWGSSPTPPSQLLRKQPGYWARKTQVIIFQRDSNVIWWDTL